MRKYKLEIAFLSIATWLTVLARQSAVARRLSMGLEPSWGGEFLIIVLFIILYFVIKADWSFD